ncbi:hypothetical protein D9756_010230 [Leucocoprinus leucothites]|uniref:F-box domain-containing protein n=1 Tax=Leucocoprinus leucothites TaxID=201217 RepID=A0A8H5CVH2_9AGAR|nr:hypothetical protein D9756_010230 [Leucoagaricus leucothites]
MSLNSRIRDVPPEIWCHICQFILPSDKPNVALVCRSLYGIIVFDLYRHVEVVSRNPTFFLHAFRTLEREQDLARRLTKLTIWIHALNEVIHLEDTTPKASETLNHSKRQGPERKPRTFRQFFGRRKPDAIAVSEFPSGSPSSVVSKHTMFMNVLSKLEHLRDLVLVWRTDDGYNRTSPTTCSQLAIDTWARVAPRICSLTLDMAMFNIYESLRVPQKLKTLEELHIRITLEKHGAFRGNAIRIFTNTLIPFINQLAPQLISFSLTSLCNLNLDPLFQGMEPTPLLRQLALCLAFQSTEIWSPLALQTFLKDHSTIRQLDLRYGECCAALFPHMHNWSSHDRVLIGEAFEGSNAFTFPQLETLTLGLQFKLSNNSDLGAYASRFSGSVHSLTLLGRSLNVNQMRTVLIPFQKTLKSLSMFLRTLTPEVLCLLATLLPSLQDLTLHIQKFASSRPYDAPTKQRFLEDMHISAGKSEALNQWQLKRIHIREFAYGKGDVPAWDVMPAIAAAIPNLSSWDI